jgi:hypothetical protein
MLSQEDLLLDIQHRTHHLDLGGVVIEYWLNIMNQGNTGITLAKITVNDQLLSPEANCLDPDAEIDCLICRTGSVPQREGQLLTDEGYEGKAIWSDYSGNEQIVSVVNFSPSVG